MVEYMKNRLNYYLRIYKNTLVDHDEILLHYPDYYKKKIELEKLEFISKEEVDEFYNNCYKDSITYNEFIKTTNPMVVKIVMDEHKDEIYDYLNILFDEYKNKATLMCNLIDYIGHFNTCERNQELDEVLEQYDIVLKTFFHDNYNKLQVTADDIVRIIDKLESLLDGLDSLIEKAYDLSWTIKMDSTKEEERELFYNCISEINYFPLSTYQKNGRSRVLEYKKERKKK